MKKIAAIVFGLMLSVTAFAHRALADAPKDWGLNLQEPATSVAEEIHSFHTFMLYIIFAIVAFVLVLLLIVVFKFNEKANPEPAKFSHNTLLEVAWTIVPVIIVAVIAIKSTQLLYFTDRIDEPEMTIKTTGFQWYWGYEYPDHDGVSFNSYMIPDDEINKDAGQKRLLSTDNPVVLPVDTNIEILVTAADVIHSFAVPAFGVKVDAVPGRLNSTWVNIKKPGTYYGQCSELCGTLHAFMPIEIVAVPKDEFEEWITQAKDEYASYFDFKAARDRMAMAVTY